MITKERRRENSSRPRFTDRSGGQRERGQEEFRGVVFRDNKFVERETPPDPFLLEG